ncbi:MAG: GspE/PulE family protein [Candidatus Komeilibacteria bacterium]
MPLFKKPQHLDTSAQDEQHPHVILATSDTEKKLANKLEEIDTENLEHEAKTKAEQLSLKYIDLRKLPIAQDAMQLLSEDQSLALQAVVFLFNDNIIRIASTNPQNPQLGAKIKELEERYSAQVIVYYVSEQSLQQSLDKYSRIPKIIESISGGVEIKEEDIKKYEAGIATFQDLNSFIQKAAISDIIAIILAAALKSEASDIHIEAEENQVKFRFRIDGALHDTASLPIEHWAKIISRVKLVARLKLNITAHPQDGRFTIFIDKKKIEVRVSTVPTSYGESVVMRILRQDDSVFNFDNLGLRGKSYSELQVQIKKPNGMIICTGPTGSGKTTTLYAVLNLVNSTEKKIITLEDPIEYKIPGINQSQIDSAGNYSFSDGLRSILRQDPDIIMVGEIRDLETAEVAINAALTGHLMLSTMHTNSAAGAIPRLLAMGVKPFLLAPSINAIEAQRLVRKLCQYCKKPAELDNATMTLVLNELNKLSPESGYKVDNLNTVTFYTSPGCEKCHGLGYKGRIGLFEILTMSPAVEKLILSGTVSEYDLEDLAVKAGMVTMIQDGILKSLEGITSIDEVLSKTE